MKIIFNACMAGMIAVFLLSACASRPAELPAATLPPTQAETQTTTAAALPTPQADTALPNLPTSTQPVATAPQLTSSTATTTQAQAASPLPQWKELATGLRKPIALVEIPDGSSRLAVVEQEGKVRTMKKDGTLQPQAYLDLSGQVATGNVEQGLLGITFHPKFSSNGFFYVYYIDLNGNVVVARFHADPGGSPADPASQKVLLTVKKQFPNHNGGQLAFGPDGYLYIGVGDGGSEGDPQNRGQSLDTHLAKILRIDVDHGDPYAIPATNPFGKSIALPEIYEVGLRNPWRFSFDKTTSDLYIGDVGQDKYEEVDFVAAGSPGGLNFGWSFREGLHAYKGTPPPGLKLVDPVVEYDHSQGCAIIGGYVYRGQQIPSMLGTYFYGDDCSGQVWGLKHEAGGKWQNQLLYQTHLNISSFGQDLSGEMYLLDLTGGRVLRLAAN